MEKYSEKIKLAEEKFGYFLKDYALREEIKELGYKLDNKDLIIFSHWSRSLVASDYNLNHPSYLEYKKHYKIGDVDWLEKNKSYVSIDKYLIKV